MGSHKWPFCSGGVKLYAILYCHPELSNPQKINSQVRKNTIFMTTYLILAVLLIGAELFYFRIADHFNIIDKPNERSSHSSIVLRGGGIIFLIGVLFWAVAVLCGGFSGALEGNFGDVLVGGSGDVPGGGFSEGLVVYPWFLLAMTLAAGISFVDDVRSLPDSVRLVVQFVAMGLLILQLFLSSKGEGLLGDSNLLINIVFVVVALIVCVGATNIYNFMDGINGITAGYSIAVLLPLLLMNRSEGFMSDSFLVVSLISVLVFSFFNFRPRGKAKCFAGDVGSVGIAFILLFAIGMLIVRTGDVTWLIFLLVYGVDGCLTICHRILLHENLGEAHRKHAYQLMANELKMSHPVVSLIYMALQLLVSLGFIYLCPVIASASGLSLVACHWIYLALALVLLAVAYILFKKKYYHLHEEYLASLK